MRKSFIIPVVETQTPQHNQEISNANLIHCPKCNNIIGAYDIGAEAVFYDGRYCNMCGERIAQTISGINTCAAKCIDITRIRKRNNTK